MKDFTIRVQYEIIATNSFGDKIPMKNTQDITVKATSEDQAKYFVRGQIAPKYIFNMEVI